MFSQQRVSSSASLASSDSAYSQDSGLGSGTAAAVTTNILQSYLENYRDERHYAQTMTHRTSLVRDFFPQALQMIDTFLKSQSLAFATSTTVITGYKATLTIESDNNFQSIYQMLRLAVSKRCNILKMKVYADYQEDFDRAGARIATIEEAITSMNRNGYNLPADDAKKVKVLFRLNAMLQAMVIIEQKLITGFSKQFREKIKAKKQAVTAEFSADIDHYQTQRHNYFQHIARHQQEADTVRGHIAHIAQKDDAQNAARTAFHSSEMKQTLELIVGKFEQLKAFYAEHQVAYNKILELEYDMQVDNGTHAITSGFMGETEQNREEKFATLMATKADFDSYKSKGFGNYFATRKAEIAYKKAVKAYQTDTKELYQFGERKEKLELKHYEILQEIARLSENFPFHYEIVKNLEREIAELQETYRRQREAWNVQAAFDYNKPLLMEHLDREHAKLTTSLQQAQHSSLHADLFAWHSRNAQHTMQAKKQAVSFIPGMEMRHADAQKYLRETIKVDAVEIYASLEACYASFNREADLQIIPTLLETSRSFCGFAR